MKTYACDWTHWQQVVCPAQAIHAEGFGMVKLKVGGAQREGRYFEDPMFFENAMALLNVPELIPAAYWFLMPGRARAQAALFMQLLEQVDAYSWAAFVDVEQTGVTWHDFQLFADTWAALTGGRQLNIYSSKRFWILNMTMPEGGVVPADICPFLEEAHWVSATLRNDPTQPYASQQVKGIYPDWWEVRYGGWQTANMIQFSDNVMVANKRTVSSVFLGTKRELRAALGLAA